MRNRKHAARQAEDRVQTRAKACTQLRRFHDIEILSDTKLAGWLAGWMAGLLACWLAAWLPGCLAGWLPGCLAAWLPA